MDKIVSMARRFAHDGANIIDIGCEPGEPWAQIADSVQAVRDLGLRVSVDSLNPAEIAPAVAAGAELVLSVNSTNRTAAADWGCEVVAIPDDFKSLGGLEDTLQHLEKSNVPFRIDPILEPIGCGFTDSLNRYVTVRRNYPEAELMMGIGNLTELTDVDSAGVNVLLLGICEELQIRSVLTTQVINWARSSVRECDLGRRLVHYALKHGTVPKHIEPGLVMLRDAKLLTLSDAELADMHANLKDPNYRIFAAGDKLHLMNNDVHLKGDDPFEIFERLLRTKPSNVSPDHAFYLGYEMAKAITAITLGKQYNQDQALDWGLLTRQEVNHRSKRKKT
jgi:dihydropteroate synthase-like protein